MRLPQPALVAAIVAGLGVATGAWQSPTFRASVDMVRIDALVTSRGKPVEGLRASDFDVVDNGVAQTVRTAEADRRFNVSLVLDCSDSVKAGRFRPLVDGVRALLGELGAGEQVALVTFDSRVAVRTKFTAETEAVRLALVGIEPGGATAMNDAVFTALLSTPADARALVVLFSDGEDNASWLSGKQVIETARRADVVVCPVVVGLVGEGAARPSHERFLEALAAGTGGRVFRAESPATLRASFVKTLAEFRSRYLIGYTPSGVPRDDGWHRLKVGVKGRAADVVAKDGYLSRPAR